MNYPYHLLRTKPVSQFQCWLMYGLMTVDGIIGVLSLGFIYPDWASAYFMKCVGDELPIENLDDFLNDISEEHF